ncbi:hypothetical protein N7466_006813 [Penicillium verhagenii]|uniref:uncharacterized protein n=1 Tax=Penicillium verhagenii TaxID=1562060 RepID=UPI0025455845|nr:uncharacterized protein N7466_006813 [Penicillium verhagenii]KAJ5927857.1 hypothetical protein N7466_006813 [Penicillium verhagenii]
MTTHNLYTTDGAIEDFFNSNPAVTRQQCDEFAISHAGGVSTALQMQGVCSYTVTAGPNASKLFQFRDENSTIDMRNIGLAKAIHSEFVASCEYLGIIGNSQPLHIYEMDKLPGTPHIMAHISPDDMSQNSNAIRDLARFFAQSWNNDQRPSSDETAVLLAEFETNFGLLARDLPSRFAPNLERVRLVLPSLFSKALPFVLSHRDLNTMNILTNTETGNITGIVDWAESRILPFGFALYGLENVFGQMDSEGWHYYDRYHEMERLFWQRFREEARNFSDADLSLIRAARMAGLFYQYGFHFDIKGVVRRVRVEESDGSLAYLDAFCTADEWSPFE